jgi:hypothetical protein
LHAEQVFSLISAHSALPQLAHDVGVSSVIARSLVQRTVRMSCSRHFFGSALAALLKAEPSVQATTANDSLLTENGVMNIS